jgi:DNA repair exonuclease SbcCD ATPase subunit
MASYDEAVQALYRGPLETFVAERKRLAAELKAGGDKEGAARLAKLGRPSISAWAVNQLFWYEREAFERLLTTADRVRRGERDASAEYQRALSALRALAAACLAASGHVAAEATLRRVTTTLSALAVTGGFEPDPLGALVADRDPPGFEVLHTLPSQAERGADIVRDGTAEAKRREQAELERKRAEAERRRLEEERARTRAEREKLKTALGEAQANAQRQEREVDRLRQELNHVEAQLADARSAMAKLKEALAALD